MSDDEQELFIFAIGYTHTDGLTYDAEIIAADFDDAEQRLRSILQGPLTLHKITDTWPASDTFH